MARFFGPDQSWRDSTSLADLQTDFASEFGMQTAESFNTGTHATTHELMVSNLRAMFSLLSVEPTDS